MPSDERPDGGLHTPRFDGGTSLGYFLGADFFPPIKLDRKAGSEFCAMLADYASPMNLSLESNEWKIAFEKFQVSISANGIQLSATKPEHAQEWYEEKYHLLLSRFGAKFGPKLALGSKALVRRLLNVDGDARAFIGGDIMNMPPDRLARFGRPAHAIGLRLFFPSYDEIRETGEREEVVSSEDWSVNVKIESWISDPAVLFLEADAHWQEPQEWNETSVGAIVERLQTVSTFVDEKVIGFLRSHDVDDSQ